VVAEAGTNVQPRPYLTRRERIYGVAYSPDGSRLAAGAADGSITIYETEFYQPMLDLPPHRGAEYSYVYSLVWTPDGTRLITASGDKTLRIWDALSPFARRRQVEAIGAAREPMRRHVEDLITQPGGAENAWRAIGAEGALSLEERIAARRAIIERWAASRHPS